MPYLHNISLHAEASQWKQTELVAQNTSIEANKLLAIIPKIEKEFKLSLEFWAKDTETKWCNIIQVSWEGIGYVWIIDINIMEHLGIVNLLNLDF